MAKTDLANTDPTIKAGNRGFTAGRLMGVGAGAMLVVELLTACGVNATEKPDSTPSPEKTPVSQVELIQQNLANRPAVGSEEYNQNVTDNLIVPYVAGQAPEEVVAALNHSMDTYLELGVADGPASKEDVMSWMKETGQSPNDLVGSLNLSYFDQGASNAWSGENESVYISNVISGLAPIRVSREADILLENLEAGKEPVSFDPGIKSANETEIKGTSTAHYTGISEPGVINYDLIATDVDGDNNPDVWRWVGSGL